MGKRVGELEKVQHGQASDLKHHKERIEILHTNQDRIFNKLDGLSWKLALLIGGGVLVQVLLPYLVKRGG